MEAAAQAEEGVPRPSATPLVAPGGDDGHAASPATPRDDPPTRAVAEAVPRTAALPSGWEAHVSRSTGKEYYQNRLPYETQYEFPAEPATPLPSGWVVSEEEPGSYRSLYSGELVACLLYTSPSPRDATLSRMPSSA